MTEVSANDVQALKRTIEQGVVHTTHALVQEEKLNT